MTPDVVVVGGGSAGVAAAVSAAEEGARTLLVEASGAVGGTLAWQWLEHSAGFHDVHGTQVTGGIGQRLVDRLVLAGGSPGHVPDDVGYTATRTPVDHATLALTQSILLDEAGVEVWLQSMPCGFRDGSLVVRTPAGSRTLRAPALVDATGDAAVAALAGAPMQPDTAETQPASLAFKVGGVDVPALLDYLRAHPSEVRAGSVIADADAEHANVWGLGTLLREGRDRGLLSLHRTELHLAAWSRRGEVVLNLTRTPVAAGDGWLGAAHARLSRQVLDIVGWLRAMVPGFGACFLTAVGDRVGVRESRRVVGAYTMTGADVHHGARFPDAIGRGAFPVDVHSATAPGLSHTDGVGAGYEIPLRALQVPDVPNLLVAGRCVSSTHEANGTLRITATCFVTGEAAGVAAATAAAEGVPPVKVAPAPVRERLRGRGAILDSEP
ncbi:FAD-dependent oxidoreductase [Amycolatopsis endophytica]|uniref:Glycine/D-amino acid oxidase-like deaminating enzyme n=1 Tax=Amycolatopsis endophytica TaxID=860233 RepID=A0A853BDS0_9PSEU|nr:FAD-dependent oxidoreductase [Amycolatopsis endophytica]NYI93399.1 glycine/D-amino acid oxidase-like deaminating enzyme [Amycolatopsis endophytica]